MKYFLPGILVNIDWMVRHNYDIITISQTLFKLVSIIQAYFIYLFLRQRERVIFYSCIYILRCADASFSFSAVRSKVSAWHSALRGIYSDSYFDWSMKNGGKIVANQIWIFSEGRILFTFGKLKKISPSAINSYHPLHIIMNSCRATKSKIWIWRNHHHRNHAEICHSIH